MKKLGSNPLYVINDEVFKAWFTVSTEANSEGSPEAICDKIYEYGLVDAGGAELNSDVISMSKIWNEYIH